MKPAKICFIPYGIRADLFQSDGKDPSVVREKLGAAPGEVVAAFISRLSRRKNPECFIDAARLLARTPVPIRFIIVGGAGRITKTS